MYYELRTYTIKPTKLAAWLALYQSDALAVQTEHLGNLVGFFFPPDCKRIKTTSSYTNFNNIIKIG